MIPSHNWLMDFAHKNNIEYTNGSINQFIIMCDIIYDKIMNPEVKECSFVEFIVKDNIERAMCIADRRNKAALSIGLYQKFIIDIKHSPEYISKMRDKKLNELLK